MDSFLSGMSWAFELGVPGGRWTALGALAAICLLAFLAHREVRRVTRRTQAYLLFALRLVGLWLGFLAVVQPQWVQESYSKSKGQLAVLVDASRSMAVSGDEGSRFARLRTLVSKWTGDAPERGVSAYRFGESLSPAPLADVAEAPADQANSRLDAVLTTLLDGDVDGAIGAVVVVTDGAGEVSDLRPEAWAERGVRVHSVFVGDDAHEGDDAVVEVTADTMAFLRQAARVSVKVRGTANGVLPVTLREGERVVAESAVSLDETGQGQTELTFVPQRVGRVLLEVTVPRSPGDRIPENNTRAFVVDAVRDRLRVLLVAGQPSWDERFLRSFLKRDPAIDLISFFILRTPGDLTMASPDELALIPFPTDELFSEHLGSFDLLVFQNFEFGPYEMAGYLPRVREYVRRGGAFVMLGGEQSFAGGGYAGTPLSEVLPVQLSPNLSGPAGVVEGAVRPAIARDYRHHPVLELRSDVVSNARAWAALAPLEGLNRISAAKPDAQVLLTHPRLKADDGSKLPILTLGAFGQGRVMALMSDTSWRWGMATAGAVGDVSSYERFWDRATRWLTKDPALEPSQITTDTAGYGRGAAMDAEGLARDAQYEPLVDSEVRLLVVGTDGGTVSESTVRTDEEGRFARRLEAPTRPGGYRLLLSLRDDAVPLTETSFVVEEAGRELSDVQARATALKALSEATGGTFYGDEDAAPSLNRFDTTRVRLAGTVRAAPFASPWFLLCLGLLLAGEWFLRRRLGLR